MIYLLGAVHKVCHAIFDDFWPPPVTNCHKSWTPLKVCHTSEQKVKRMETVLNSYNRYYYILSNNNGCLSVSNEMSSHIQNTYKSTTNISLQ